MGEVYDAVDTELQRRVALKTVHEGSGRELLERFKREVALATRVTHPNVCRIFDVGRHRRTWPSGEATEVIFLTMELLEGETLLDKLRRRRLTPDEALPLLTQIAAGLDAAHRASVIHRDLKPENVVLVPDGESLRAVVADFGIARSSADEQRLDATATGLVVGTPAYMAPEQAQGLEPTPRTDVYAFGLLAFEMLTGRLPEDPGSLTTMLMARISRPPRSPREFVPALDPRWERAILRCLALEPQERFASAGEAVLALTAEPPRPEPAPPGPRRLRLALAAAAALVLAAAGVFAWSRRPEPRKAVAVLGFKNMAGRAEDAWISTALAEMLSTELAAAPDLRTVAGESVTEARSELKLPETDGYGPESLKKIRRRLGADFVVVGSFLSGSGAGRLRLDLKLQDAHRGETVAATAEEGGQAELSALVGRAGAWLRERLETGAIGEAHAEALRAAAPPSYEAARLYATGLERMRRYDARSACEHFRRAIDLAPGFTLARVRLAEALASLRREREALAEAKLAFERSDRLAREDRLLVEALYRELSHDHPRSIAVRRELFEAEPDDVEHGLLLAGVQSRAGRQGESLQTLAALRRLPSPWRDDPRIPLGEAHAAMVQGDFRRMLAGAEEGARKADALPARILKARALRQKAVALTGLGRPTEAFAQLEEARRLFAEAEQQEGLAAVAHAMASTLLELGRLEEALRFVEEADALYQAIGMLNTSFIPYTRGRILADLGRLPDAERALLAAIEMERALHGSRGYYSECELGRLLLLRGDLIAAAPHLAEAERASRAAGDQSIQSRSLFLKGLKELIQGELLAARRSLEEALAMQRANGEVSLAPSETSLWLAIVALEDGRPDGAERSAREAAGAFAQHGAAGRESLALAVLAEALGLLGRSDEASAALRDALARPSEAPELRVRRAVHASRTLRLLGKREEAERLAREAVATAAASGLGAALLEARLALVRCAAATPGEQRQEALKLEKDAEAMGAALIGRRAREILGQQPVSG